MRDPSLHITESQLSKALKHILYVEGSPIKWPYNKMAKDIVNLCKTHSIASRSITITNDKLLKKTDKLKLAGRSDTSIFAQMLLYSRRKLKHRGLQLIEPGSNDWFNLKETCKLATDFCNEFQIPIKQGYQVYLNIGLPMMKNFSIFKFKTLHASICNKYEAQLKISADNNATKTKEAHDIYLAIISEKIGYSQGYEDNPEKYQYFVDVAADAKRYGISIKQYLRSQFDAFDWRAGVPDPAQLVGTKAGDRLQKWAFSNNIMLGSKKVAVDFKNIKKKRYES